MKFFFRIIDQNKARNADSPVSFMPQFIPRHFRRCRATRKNSTPDRKSNKKSTGKITQKPPEEPPDIKIPLADVSNSERLIEKPSEVKPSEESSALHATPFKIKKEECNTTPPPQPCRDKPNLETSCNKEVPNNQDLVIPKVEPPAQPNLVASSNQEVPKTLDLVNTKMEPPSPIKSPEPEQKLALPKTPKQPSVMKTKSYTSITLNRSENVEIITKIKPVSTKDGRPIGHHIIKQTIKKGSKFKSPRKYPKGQVTIPKLVISKKNLKKFGSPKSVKPEADHVFAVPVVDDEKSRFFSYMRLAPIQEKKQPAKVSGGQKRKSTSPVKNDAKIPKIEPNKVKIILQDKQNNGLQSLISSCKIPSSLSITIKEGSDSDSGVPPVAPPVKNFIEILKLPEETTTGGAKSPALDFGKFCDNDSEQKVDEDLAQIAKSLTEKIPMSTTVSQIVGPKPQFQIPVKTNIPPKPQIQPAPVPEISKAVKLTPRTPQTFQKIFEESLKKPPDGVKTSPVESTTEDTTTPKTTAKKNILEIATQLFKKTKIKLQEGETAAPKVPIPRLPPPTRSPKLVPQTVASLHSTSLGMNYTVSVGQQSPSKVMKSNGIVSPVKAEPVPNPILECKPSVSPLNELKTVKTEFKVPSPSSSSPKLPTSNCPSPKAKTPSPKSSPVVKHMYAPALPSSGVKPKLPTPTPKASSSPTLTANEILEKYNIQNLAQLTANFNLNPSVLATNQLAAFQHAMLLKHFEMHNRQNWLSRNQGPLLQYEKYLQSLNGSHGQT